MVCLVKWVNNFLRLEKEFIRGNTVVFCTFSVNCLNACETPLFFGGPVGYPIGTIFVCLGAYPPIGYGTPYPLYIVR